MCDPSVPGFELRTAEPIQLTYRTKEEKEVQKKKQS